MTVMPMFPLGTPLLPGSVLPLHVFEPRYRQMMRDVLAADSDPPRFGVVMIERGREVGGGDERTSVGTVAHVVEMEATPDGRYVLVAVGAARLRVRRWLPDDPYPTAEVEIWPDEASGPDSVDLSVTIDGLRDRVRALLRLARELGDPGPPPGLEISDDVYLAPFHLAAIAPIGPVDRQRILAAAGPGERLVALAGALDDAKAVLEFRRA